MPITNHFSTPDPTTVLPRFLTVTAAKQLGVDGCFQDNGNEVYVFAPEEWNLGLKAYAKYSGSLWKLAHEGGMVGFQLMDAGLEAPSLDDLEMQLVSSEPEAQEPEAVDLGSRIERHKQRDEELHQQVADLEEGIAELIDMLDGCAAPAVAVGGEHELGWTSSAQERTMPQDINYVDSPNMAYWASKHAAKDAMDLVMPGTSELEGESKKDFKEDTEELEGDYAGSTLERRRNYQEIEALFDRLGKGFIPPSMKDTRKEEEQYWASMGSPEEREAKEKEEAEKAKARRKARQQEMQPTAGKDRTAAGPFPSGMNPPRWLPPELKPIWRAAVERYVQEEGGDPHGPNAYRDVVFLFKQLVKKYGGEGVPISTKQVKELQQPKELPQGELSTSGEQQDLHPSTEMRLPA